MDTKIRIELKLEFLTHKAHCYSLIENGTEVGSLEYYFETGELMYEIYDAEKESIYATIALEMFINEFSCKKVLFMRIHKKDSMTQQIAEMAGFVNAGKKKKGYFIWEYHKEK